MYYVLKSIHVVFGSLLTGSLIGMLMYPPILDSVIARKIMIPLTLIVFILAPATGLAIIIIQHYAATGYITAIFGAWGLLGCLWLLMLYYQQKNHIKSQKILIWWILGITSFMYYWMIQLHSTL